MVIAMAACARRQPPARRPRGGAIFVVYHKTGYAFSRKLCGSIEKTAAPAKNWGCYLSENLTREKITHEGREGIIMGHAYTRSLNLRWRNWSACAHRVVAPSTRWVLPAGMRTIHWYREPTTMIVSGYHYHRGQHSHHEGWMLERSTCLYCLAAEHATIFSACGHTCTYAELLNQASAVGGVQLEGVMARQSMIHMVGNLYRWADNPSVLHISMDHIAAGFNQTMACILRFLGLGVEENLGFVQHLDPGIERNLRRDHHLRRHRTSDKYNNTESLRTWLKRWSPWRENFAAARAAISSIAERQHHMYGCIAPE